MWPSILFKCSDLTVKGASSEFLVTGSVFKLLSEHWCLLTLATVELSHIRTPHIILLAFNDRRHTPLRIQQPIRVKWINSDTVSLDSLKSVAQVK